jgi:6-phosphogluconolactonase
MNHHAGRLALYRSKLSFLLTVLASATTLMSCGSGSSSIGGSIPGSPESLLIGTDFAGTTDHVFVVAVGAGGGLAAAPGSPFTAGSEPAAVTVSASAHLAFVANAGDNSVSVFKISTAGGLSSVGPAVPSGAILPLHLALNNAGNFLIVGNANGGSILFQVNSTSGAISQSNSEGLGYSGAAFSPDSKAIFSLTASDNPQSLTFSVEPATGATSVVFNGPALGHVIPGPIVLHPSGKFLYVPVKQSILIPPDPNAKGGLLSFSVGSDGAWSPLATSPLDSTTNFTFAVIDPSGSHVYAISDVGRYVYGFNVDSATGELTAVSGSPFSTNATNTFALAFDFSGKFLFVSQPGAISSFQVAQDGALTAVNGSPFASGDELSSLASLQP